MSDFIPGLCLYAAIGLLGLYCWFAAQRQGERENREARERGEEWRRLNGEVIHPKTERTAEK